MQPSGGREMVPRGGYPHNEGAAGNTFSEFASSRHLNPTAAAAIDYLYQQQYSLSNPYAPVPCAPSSYAYTNSSYGAQAFYGANNAALQGHASRPVISNGTTYYYGAQLPSAGAAVSASCSSDTVAVSHANNHSSIGANGNSMGPPTTNTKDFSGETGNNIAVVGSDNKISGVQTSKSSSYASGTLNKACPSSSAHERQTASDGYENETSSRRSAAVAADTSAVNSLAAEVTNNLMDNNINSLASQNPRDKTQDTGRGGARGHRKYEQSKSQNSNQFDDSNINPNSSYKNSTFNRGKRRENNNYNNREGRGARANYNNSSQQQQQCDERNSGRDAAVAEAAAFMTNSSGSAVFAGASCGENGQSSEAGEYSENQSQHQRQDRGAVRGGRFQRNARQSKPGREIQRDYERANGEEYSSSNGRNYNGESGLGRYDYDDSRGRGRRGWRGRERGGRMVEEYSQRERDYAYNRDYNAGKHDNNYYGTGQSRGAFHNNNRRDQHRNNGSGNWNENGQDGYRNERQRCRDESEQISKQPSPTAEDNNSGVDSSSSSKERPTSNRNPFGSNASKNRRQNRGGFAASVRFKTTGNAEEDTKNQRDQLTEQLQKGSYECSICCERIKPVNAIWSCKKCYNCYHLHCIKKWASSSKEGGESGWRCPTCNNQSSKRPNSYQCFCGKLRDPEYNRRDTPHSCGELCGRARDNQWCTHNCNVLCHPGPCPPCLAYLKKWCGCGAVNKDVRCNNAGSLLCGGVCSKPLSCTSHMCSQPCHDGDCADCQQQLQQHCHCGKQKRSVNCNSETRNITSFECAGICEKTLACGNHKCKQLCHSGACHSCELAVDLITHCPCGKISLQLLKEEAATGKKLRNTAASVASLLPYNSKRKNAKRRNDASKADDSEVSLSEPNAASKTTDESLPRDTDDATEIAATFERMSCADRIATCGDVCSKRLRCGKPGSFHTCKSLCHEGDCPPCRLNTPVRCRCGNMDQNIRCCKLATKADEVTCERQCKKLRFCGRHRCAGKCCIEVDHVCPLKCGRYLSCGNHRCSDDCHPGNCQRCQHVSWEELTCHCGAEMMLPPVYCGSKPPPCSELCARQQSCQHPVSHTCHPEENCPPCIMLMEAPCFGKHKIMRNTCCYQKAMSCGEMCDKSLPCGQHKCNRVCHDGPCITAMSSAGGVASSNNNAASRNSGASAKSSTNAASSSSCGNNNASSTGAASARSGGSSAHLQCPQNCTRPRQVCGHPCSSPCHAGDCPNTSCRQKVMVQCKCGNRSTAMQCSENEREYRTMETAKLATQLQHVGTTGASVDLSHILSSQSSNNKDRFKRLECNDVCASKERASRLALALQIENPESRGSLGTAMGQAAYSDFLKDETKKDPSFASTVHKAMHDLVVKARDSKQKSRSHSFPAMSRDKRQFIHEYCKFFGCDGMSYDEEPKKNVVVTARKGMCLLPVCSIVEVVQRENGHKKVPGPVWGTRRQTSSTPISDSRSSGAGGVSGSGGLRRLEKGGSIERTDGIATTLSKPVIDYFDFDD
uniref:Transcriptional repressor NF-X1-like n=1 Tax=Hirondellea gigas TaxID=1518452 RepID=A0A6A7FWG0_9CRUS